MSFKSKTSFIQNMEIEIDISNIEDFLLKNSKLTLDLNTYQQYHDTITTIIIRHSVYAQSHAVFQLSL